MTRDTVNVLSIPWVGNTARKLVGDILNVLMMDQVGFSQVHCPCPYSVFTMSWVRKLVFVPSVRGRDLSTNETQFFRLMRMGILDGREGYDMPMTASTRAMRHTTAVSARLFVMFEHERQRVRCLGMSDEASLTRPWLGGSFGTTGQGR